jgi:hypothetical protein
MNELLQKVWNLFLENIKRSSSVQALIKSASSGNASYSDAQKYSSLLSNILVQSASQVYPTDSQSVLDALRDTTICKNYFNQVDSYVYEMQKAVNQSNNLGLNAVKVIGRPTLVDQSVRSSDDYDSDMDRYSSKAEYASNSRVDDIERTNAEFQSNAGYKVTVSRYYDGVGLSQGRQCEWCLDKCGVNVPYDEAYDQGMFARHEGCGCVIEYNNSGERSYQSSKGGRESWIDYDKKRVDKATLQEYSSTPTKELRTMWVRGVDEGWISALVSFDSYSNAYTTLKNELVGERTSDGIVMREISEHFMQRVCGTSRDPKIYKEQHRIVRRDGCEPADIVDALLNGTSRPTIIKNGRVSKSYFNNECLVTINPETGMLIQCNRYN